MTHEFCTVRVRSYLQIPSRKREDLTDQYTAVVVIYPNILDKPLTAFKPLQYKRSNHDTHTQAADKAFVNLFQSGSEKNI